MMLPNHILVQNDLDNKISKNKKFIPSYFKEKAKKGTKDILDVSDSCILWNLPINLWFYSLEFPPFPLSDNFLPWS